MAEELNYEHHFGYALKKTFFFNLPIIMQRFLSLLCGFVAMWIVARLGSKQLAAGALIVSGINFVLIPGWAFLFSLSILAARTFAQKNFEQTGILLRKGLILSTFLGIAVLPILFSIPTILLWLHQDPELVILARDYCFANSYAIIPSFWMICFMQFFFGLHKQKVVMVLSGIMVVLLAIFGYFFTLSSRGPHLQMRGVPYAFFTMYMIVNVICIAYLFRKEFHPYKIFRFTFRWTHLKDLIFLGWPIGIQVAGEFIAFSMATIFIGWIGQEALAAQQIVTQINYILFSVPFALSQGIGMLVSHSLGLEKKIEAKNYAYSAIVIGFIFSILFGLLYLFFPKFLASLYINIKDPASMNILKITYQFFMVYIFLNLFDIFKNVITGILRGYKDTKFPMIIGIFTTWTGIILGYIFTFIFSVGPEGIQIGFMLGCMVGSYLLWKRFKKYARN